MDQSSLDRHRPLVGHAYRLGHAAIALDLDARRRWESAEPGEPADEIFGPEEQGSPFPTELGRYGGVIDEAGRGLVAALPELTRDQLQEALRRAWLALGRAWLGRSHRRMIVERDEGGDGGVEAIAASPMGQREWRDFHLAVHRFCESLPEGVRDFAALGPTSPPSGAYNRRATGRDRCRTRSARHHSPSWKGCSRRSSNGIRRSGG